MPSRALSNLLALNEIAHAGAAPGSFRDGKQESLTGAERESVAKILQSSRPPRPLSDARFLQGVNTNSHNVCASQTASKVRGWSRGLGARAECRTKRKTNRRGQKRRTACIFLRKGDIRTCVHFFRLKGRPIGGLLRCHVLFKVEKSLRP